MHWKTAYAMKSDLNQRKLKSSFTDGDHSVRNQKNMIAIESLVQLKVLKAWVTSSTRPYKS